MGNPPGKWPDSFNNKIAWRKWKVIEKEVINFKCTYLLEICTELFSVEVIGFCGLL